MWSGTMCEDRSEEFVFSPGSYLLSGGTSHTPFLSPGDLVSSFVE